MQIETLKDILHWTKGFHQHLSQCLSHCAKKNTNERAKMILTYLADHESSLVRTINSFETSDSKHALNTWCYEYVNKQPIVQNNYCDSPFAELDAAQIMEVIVDQHQQVIQLYRDLASQAVILSAQEMLASLRSVEEHEMMRMVQSVNRFSDM